MSGIINRRPKRRFGAPVRSGCPSSGCVVCRTVGRSDPKTGRFMNERTDKVFLDTGQSLDTATFADGAILVTNGGMVVRQRALDDGRRQIVDFAFPGEAISLGRSGADMTAFAAIPSIVCRIDVETVTSLKRTNPEAAIRLSELALARQDHDVEHLIVLGRLSVPERIAYLLYDLAARTGKAEDGGVVVDLPMTREDIADYLGINVETVSRQLSRLRKDGVLSLPQPDRVVIRDLARLRDEIPFQPRANGGGRPHAAA